MNFDNGNLSVEVARVKIESWCAYQDRCTFEVVNKLTSFGLDESQISSLIIHLTETQFLNELRFTESFISGKIRIKKWGKIKIRMALHQKKIPRELISACLLRCDTELYWDNLIHLTEKKDGQKFAKDNEMSHYKRVFMYLSSKGYESDLIQDAINLIKKSKS